MLSKSDVDLVAIITPHNTHFPIACQCLRAGRHVICEKPMALTTEECDKLIEEAGKRELLVTAYHNRHWNGDTLQLVQKVKQERVVGDIVRIELHPRVIYAVNDSWRCSRKLSGGIAYDWGVHLLEAALQLVDSELLEVSGYSHNGFRSGETRWGDDVIEDDFQLTARFGNGIWVTLSVSGIDCLPKRDGRGLVEVTGTGGTFVSDPTGWKIYKREGEQIVSESGKNPPDNWQCFYDEVKDYFTDGKKLTITPEWARRPVHILDLARRSAEIGHTLPAKYK
jgi:predicted dehydrogenase